MTDALLAVDRDITLGKMAEQTEAGREEEEISLYQLHPEVRMSLAPARMRRRNSVITGSGKNRRRFRDLYPPGIQCWYRESRLRRHIADSLYGIPERRPECSGSDKRCRVSHYRSKKQIILTT